ncbi:Armadillo-type fold [Plasmopara halstedii]|uniref:Armadillo-type fold n=1 Tax=Plasmopara halstedii TaxID=4781 RepID=A0A0P1ARW6_PLAHL|nr:Armadillo-type fold [Plasmopara halstedii]CEG44052.1 Armadillo-type fold [Plasmopara halstedii]|eukprot:XP_024580421.1 Armadillo-type fold [Plasmopara halstedii]
MSIAPHTLYRVFHKDPVAPNDQFPLALSSYHAKSAPTDLHLREFSQLEVHIKALQLQATNPTVVTGSLTECFLFYSRLFTVESFVWPDFLTAVFTKLAEYFASSENDIARSTILRVFQRAKGHLTQVNDPSKLLVHLLKPLLAKSTTTRTLTLQMLATMPSLVVQDTILHQQLLKGVLAANHQERLAAIDAARMLLPLLPSFRNDVLMLSLEEKTTTLCCLLAEAVENPVEARKMWIHCAEQYERFADNKSAVATIRAMTTMTAVYPQDLLEMHGKLLYHVLDRDPRAYVRNFIILITQQLITSTCVEMVHELLASILEGVFARISQNSSGLMSPRIQLSGLLLLEKYANSFELGEKAKEFLQLANKLLAHAMDERFGKAYTSILSNVVRKFLLLGDTKSPEQAIDTLLLLLHPQAAIATKSTWGYALAAIAQLCQNFPKVVPPYVTTSLIELLSIPIENALDNDIKLIRTSVFQVLGAQFQPPPFDIIQKTFPLLLKEISAVGQPDAARLHAVAATFFLWTQDLAPQNSEVDNETNTVIVDFERRLIQSELYKSHAERYEMAKLAMLRGRFTLALQLIREIAAKNDTECFGGWLHALQSLCEAESHIVSERSVHMESLHALSRANMYLQAARTSNFRFDFQLHLLTLRFEWEQLLLSTQQLAGEAAYTNQPGHAAGREGQLCLHLRALADKFGVLRTMLLGAPQHDLVALQVHVNLCLVLAAGVKSFLLLESPDLITLQTKLGNCANSLQWNARIVEMLCESIRLKSNQIAKLSRSRQPTVGALVLKQLVNALCGIPIALPRLFFRSRLRTEHRLRSSAQFLTYAENKTFTSKPRTRSQLGVPLGTDFVSVLKGVLALSQCARSYWQELASAIEVEVLVCVAGETRGKSLIDELINGVKEEKLVHYRMTVTLPLKWDQVVTKVAEDGDDQTQLYVPFETPVHVKSAQLAVKGSFELIARLKLVDNKDQKWHLAATGSRRGFIVY